MNNVPNLSKTGPRLRWLPRPRFSLRSLLFAVLLLGSAGGLRAKWEPWVLERRVHPDGPVSDLICSPNGASVVSVFEDWRETWDTKEFNRALQWTDVLTGKTRDIATDDIAYSHDNIFSPDGTLFLVVHRTGIIGINDSKTGEELRSLRGIDFTVKTVRFSSDGTRIIAVNTEGNVWVWDTTDGELLFHVDFPKYSKIDDFHDYRPWLESNRFDNTWSDNNEARRLFEGDKTASATTLQRPQDIVLFTADGSVKFYDGSLGAFKSVFFADSNFRDFKINPPSARAKDIETDPFEAIFSNEGSRVVTSNVKGADLWDGASGNKIALLQSRQAAIACASFSPNGKWIVTGGVDHSARIFKAEHGEEAAVLTGHTETVQAARFFPDGTRVITSGFDGRAIIWDAASGTPLRVLFTNNEFTNDCGTLFQVLNDDRIVFRENPVTVQYWTRRRPEHAWGIAWLPEFWLTALFAVALGWSIFRDRASAKI